MKKRALISVWDKIGIADFAKNLTKLGWEIVSTGGTAKILKKTGIKIIPIEKITRNPEAFDGRMKTISFQIEGALLYDRKNLRHQKEAKKLGIQPIDMVVCNLYPPKFCKTKLRRVYPFEKVITQKDYILEKAVDNIDIGGPTMIRAAAKNYKYVAVVIDPEDYGMIIKVLKQKKEIPEKIRLELAKKVFQRTAEYDKNITKFFKSVS
ncbi:MAG TPA: hypothetical protein ENI19_01810 [Candidatus Nealsonbacteria bacterium]|uniref:MGS-like domain-containing protein n=1 Tax=marine sediment metagenome TaxID=412755 RepID=A0A0F9XMS1_9ZZZZ|nr:hypothetical protein [Candidatus Nealsonbacteria bacterium]HEB46427.1 hypothetical protein [Candidatus Nealsonbacteria bacterium]